MTLDEAAIVIKRVDRKSSDPFTPDEREALVVIGTAFKTRQIALDRFLELMGEPHEER